MIILLNLLLRASLGLAFIIAFDEVVNGRVDITYHINKIKERNKKLTWLGTFALYTIHDGPKVVFIGIFQLIKYVFNTLFIKGK